MRKNFRIRKRQRGAPPFGLQAQLFGHDTFHTDVTVTSIRVHCKTCLEFKVCRGQSEASDWVFNHVDTYGAGGWAVRMTP